MADGYKHKPTGEAAMRQKLKDQQRQIDQLRGNSPTTSAIIRAAEGLTVYNPDTGFRAQVVGGQIKFWADYEAAPDEFAYIVSNAEGALAMVAPDGGAVFMNALGTDALGNLGSAWMQASGDVHVSAGVSGGTVFLLGQTIQNNADTITLTAATVLNLFGATVKVNYGSTGSAANCVLAVDGTVLRSTSSERYKQDIEDAAIDPADVLKVQGRTWRQRSEVEADPKTDKRYIGFVAEELAELETMRQFVNYDDQGRPDSIETDRLTVALIELAKSQQGQIDALAKRLDVLEGKA